MERDIMTIDKNNEGAWRICENINGYLETQVYYFYTKKDAIKKFRQYKKNLINQQKGTMKIKCIKCNKKHDEQNMCLSINDIIENHVKEKTINDFEKNYLKGMSIENAFCGTCASQSLKIMEGKL